MGISRLLLLTTLSSLITHSAGDDAVEGSGFADDNDTAISEAVNKVVELGDEVVSNLSDNIHDLEVNEGNDIQEVDAPKHSKKCGKCKKKGFLKRNLDFCNSCDHDVTTAMTTPSSTTTTEASSTDASTTAESSTISFARKIDEKRNQKIKERCEKCIKRRFMERNEEFCKKKCVEDEETEETDETEAVEVSSSSTSTEASSTEEVATEEENNDHDEAEAEVTTMKTRKNKNKHSVKRNKNSLKNKERRDRNKERKERRN